MQHKHSGSEAKLQFRHGAVVEGERVGEEQSVLVEEQGAVQADPVHADPVVPQDPVHADPVVPQDPAEVAPREPVDWWVCCITTCYGPQGGNFWTMMLFFVSLLALLLVLIGVKETPYSKNLREENELTISQLHNTTEELIVTCKIIELSSPSSLTNKCIERLNTPSIWSVLLRKRLTDHSIENEEINFLGREALLIVLCQVHGYDRIDEYIQWISLKPFKTDKTLYEDWVNENT